MVWLLVYAAALLFVNLRKVGDYGRFEYWFAMIKLVTIVLFIVTGAALLLAHRATPQYQINGGFFPNGGFSPILALSFALFSFLGVEMVAISSGEARSASEVPRATRWTFALLTFTYVGATAMLVGITPWHHLGVRESPFVTVFEVARMPATSTVVNLVVLTAALSGANANLYAAGRMIFSLARGGIRTGAPWRVNSLWFAAQRAACFFSRNLFRHMHGAGHASVRLSLHHRRVALRRSNLPRYPCARRAEPDFLSWLSWRSSSV